MEAAGALVGAISSAPSTAKHYLTNRRAERLHRHYKKNLRKARFSRIRTEYGLLMGLLLTYIIPETLPLMQRIERYVLPGDTARAISFMETQTSSLNMIAVAGAITAQVAITALGVTVRGATIFTWVGEAFFIISLTCGVLGLFDATQIRKWLSKPIAANDKDAILSQVTDIWEAEMEQSVGVHVSSTVLDTPTVEQPVSIVTENAFHDLKERIRSQRWKILSCFAVIMLVVPARFLSLSLSCFVIGLTFYVVTMDLGEGETYEPRSIALKAYIYMFNLGGALVVFYIPDFQKNKEMLLHQRLEDILLATEPKLRDIDGAPLETPSHGSQSSPDIPLTTLRAQSVHSLSLSDQGTIEPAQEAILEADPEIVYTASPQSLPAEFPLFRNPSPSPAINTAPIFESLDLSALENLLRAQEECANASRRLLEIYRSGGQ